VEIEENSERFVASAKRKFLLKTLEEAWESERSGMAQTP